MMDTPVLRRCGWTGAGAAAMGAMCMLLACCADPESVTGFEESDTGARMRAIRAAAESNDQSKVPALVERLSSDDPAERLLAIRALERLTGTTNGFDHASGPADRAAAIERWREWVVTRRGTLKGHGA